MSEAKKDEDWDFKIPASEEETPSKKRLKKRTVSKSKTPVLNPETAGHQKKMKMEAPKASLGTTGTQKLGVESGKRRVSRSRLAKNFEILEKQEAVIKASPIDRIKAGCIDLFLLGGVGAASYFAFPYARRYVMKFLIKEGINQNLPPEQFKMLIMGTCALAGVLLFYVLPILLKGKSLGKSMKGLRIGSSKDTLSCSRFKGIVRELILRPLSLLSVLGVVFMFFNKKKQGLHDLILGTTIYYLDSEEDED